MKGAKSLITNSVGSLQGAFPGLGKMAERAGNALLVDSPSDAEDSRLDNAIGFSSNKRAPADEFRIAPYSTKPLLQKRLEQISCWGYGGKITASGDT